MTKELQQNLSEVEEVLKRVIEYPHKDRKEFLSKLDNLVNVAWDNHIEKGDEVAEKKFADAIYRKVFGLTKGEMEDMASGK